MLFFRNYLLGKLALSRHCLHRLLHEDRHDLHGLLLGDDGVLACDECLPLGAESWIVDLEDVVFELYTVIVCHDTFCAEDDIDKVIERVYSEEACGADILDLTHLVFYVLRVLDTKEDVGRHEDEHQNV